MRRRDFIRTAAGAGAAALAGPALAQGDRRRVLRFVPRGARYEQLVADFKKTAFA